MNRRDLNALPDEARLWVLALRSEPSGASLAALCEGVDRLVEGWRHKGQTYEGAWELRDGRFLLVAEPNLATAPSGCAIDGFLRRLGGLLEELGLETIPDQHVLVRRGDTFEEIPKPDLREALEKGALQDDTPVVDLALYSLGQLRQGQLLRPLQSTWIARLRRNTPQESRPGAIEGGNVRQHSA